MVDVVAVEVFRNGRFGQHPAWIGQQVGQQVIFLARQRHLTSVHPHFLGLRQQLDFSENYFGITIELPPPPDGIEPGVEFGKVERFGQVIVGPQIESLDFIIQ